MEDSKIPEVLGPCACLCGNHDSSKVTKSFLSDLYGISITFTATFLVHKIKSLRLWAKKHLFNSSTSVPKHWMLVREIDGNHTESYTLWDHTYLQSLIRNPPPPPPSGSGSAPKRATKVSVQLRSIVQFRSIERLLSWITIVQTQFTHGHPQTRRVRMSAKGLRNSMQLIVCSPITCLPFIFLAATAILCNPRLSDVSMIPDSLFCRSRDWATINATWGTKARKWFPLTNDWGGGGGGKML